MKHPKTLLILVGLGIGMASAAQASDINVNLGPPRSAPPVVVAQGWHGDRYWDGHRYWERKEWEAHHRPHPQTSRRDRECAHPHGRHGRC
ncbi:hypothetical protein [Pandoraea soli]